MATVAGHITEGAAGALLPRQRLLRVWEAAAVLGVSRSVAYELIGSGALRGLRVGRSLRVATEDVELYVARLRAEAGATDA